LRIAFRRVITSRLGKGAAASDVVSRASVSGGARQDARDPSPKGFEERGVVTTKFRGDRTKKVPSLALKNKREEQGGSSSRN